MRPHFLLQAALVVASGAASAQSSSPYQDDVPINEYLAVVEQVAPAAREGAEIYMAAFRDRCARQVRVGELRAAFASGDGDPTLMGMIRAAFAKDTAALARLRASVSCPRG